jgi:hypothetical protein
LTLTKTTNLFVPKPGVKEIGCPNTLIGAKMHMLAARRGSPKSSPWRVGRTRKTRCVSTRKPVRKYFKVRCWGMKNTAFTKIILTLQSITKFVVFVSREAMSDPFPRDPHPIRSISTDSLFQKLRPTSRDALNRLGNVDRLFV